MFTDDTDFTDVHTVQRVVDLFGRNPNLQRILKHSLGLELNPELHRPGEHEEDYVNWRRHHASLQDPLRHVVVTPDNIGELTRSSSSAYQPPLHLYNSSHSPSRLTSVDAEAKENNTESKARLLQEPKKGDSKAERKKKKKLKQKERKRLEKLEKEKQDTVKKEEVMEGAQQDGEEARKPGCGCKEESATNGKPTASAEDALSSDSSELDSSEGEEGAKSDSCTSEALDMASLFVSKAAEIAQRKINQKPKPVKGEKDKDEHKTSPNKLNAGPELERKDSGASNNPVKDYVKISNDLAVLGNKSASKGDFQVAVNYFTHAIKCNPTEYKLFGNRSFCFEKLQEYEKALADAELSLNICPGWVKGLFRKGRALAGLKRYDEAAQAFREVLQGDGSCAEAAQELMRVQITQLMEFGFTREQSSNALIIHGTVTKALEVLSKLNCGTGVVQSCTLPSVQVANVSGVSPVLSANTKLAPPTPPPPPPAAAAAAAAPPPKKPPQKAPLGRASNGRNKPPELFPVWVGNLNPPIDESILFDLFDEVGTVYSIKFLSYKQCAFINYTSQDFVDEAIRRFNGRPLEGSMLAVRYPDRLPWGLNISRDAISIYDG